MLLLAGGIGILTIASLKSRIWNNRLRSEQVGIITTPLAEAISQLVGVSGGIYLALLMMCEFIGLSGEYELMIGRYSVDFLAVTAILLSLLQPIIVVIWRKILYKR